MEALPEVLREAANPRTELVRTLVRQGLPQNEIIRRVWNVEAKGRAYQSAAVEFRQCLGGMV